MHLKMLADVFITICELLALLTLILGFFTDYLRKLNDKLENHPVISTVIMIMFWAGIVSSIYRVAW